MALWLGTKMASGRGNCPSLPSLLLTLGLHACMALHLEVSSRPLVFKVTGSGGHWHDYSGHELKLWIKSLKSDAKALARNTETIWFVLTTSLTCWLGLVYMPPVGIPCRCGDTSYLGKGSHLPPRTTRYGNLRNVCNPSHLPLLNQIFRIPPLCIEPTQGCQKCDWAHRDTRWIGGLSHQSSNLSHLHNPLQKVVIHAFSDTGFKGMQVVNYPAN